MDFYDFSSFLIIFIMLFATFYIIISNFGYSVTFDDNKPNLEKTINNIQLKVRELDNKIFHPQKQLSQLNNYDSDSDSDNDDNTLTSLKSEINSYKKLIRKKNNHISKLTKFKKNDDDDDDDDDVEIVVNKTESPNNQNNQRNMVVDPIANYDNAKIVDPLVDPLQRTSADQIPNASVAMQFNFPSQGTLDRYHRLGLLIAVEKPEESDNSHKSNRFNRSNKSNDAVENTDTTVSKENKSERNYKGVWLSENGKIEGFGNISTNDDNSILELIGKRRYHSVYRYFTSISMGNKIIKVMVHNRNNTELYSGNTVFIKELNKHYRVEIDNMDMIDYNPYVL
jgi:hypothetical protein